MSIVAIVGRPNVGKSTLFNKLIGKRKALVSDMPGVTRDRHYDIADHAGKKFILIDTGGLSFDESDAVEAKVHKQSMAALEEATVVVCLFDGRDGLMPLDHTIVGLFRRTKKPVIYAVNKADTERSDSLISDFCSLGIDVLPISAEHGRNLYELLDKIVEHLPDATRVARPSGEGMRIALVGRPNVGKSTIINRLAKEERVVVHERAGTTRDSIDVEVEYNGKKYIFVDTAGIKKRGKTHLLIDKFSTIKSLKAIEDAEIIFVVLDAAEGFVRQDIALAAHAFDSFKPTAVLINKWDIAKDPLNKEPLKGKKASEKFLEDIRFNLKELHGLPILCISGKTGLNCENIYRIAAELEAVSLKRVQTSELNRFLKDLLDYQPPPDYQGKQVKLNYVTQADVGPPVFVVFTNEPKGLKRSYKKYITSGLRRLLGETTVPIVVKFKLKS